MDFVIKVRGACLCTDLRRMRILGNPQKKLLRLLMVHLWTKRCLMENFISWITRGRTEVTGKEAVRVLVAVRAKPNCDPSSSLNKEFFKSFLDVLNHPQHSGRFNISTQFPHYKEILYKPDFRGRRLGKNVVFDMDMSARDFLAPFYLIKTPDETTVEARPSRLT
ncbi:hypothetical protein ACH5RR_004296 [Cinchona calisaya]|uniref:Uncharacterized protein n=1 Tax=Cinchona calisaya TaxID=153742 RepID=A0ABD3AXI5_9GENT